MQLFQSRIGRGIAMALFLVLSFCSSLCYVFANDNAGMGEIFTYTDFRNTETYFDRLTRASQELITLAGDVYSGKKVTAMDLDSDAMEGFHYYFYADGVYLTDIPLLEGVDFSHAKALAVYRTGVCYLMDTSHTQTDLFSYTMGYSWKPYDLTKTVALTVFSCDAGAILIPDSDWINQQYSVWATAKDRALAFIILLSAAVLSMGYLVLSVSWRRSFESPSGTHWFFTEVVVLAGVLSVVFLIQILDISYLKWLRQLFTLFGFGDNRTVYAAFALLFTALSLLFLISLLAVIRKIRESRLISGSFLWWFCRKPYLAYRRWIDGKLFRRYRFSTVFILRSVLFLVLESGLIALYVVTAVNRYWIALQVVLLLVAVALAGVYLFGVSRDLRSLNRLLNHISQLQDGNLSYRAEIPEQDVFAEYEGQLRSVGDGFLNTLRSQIAAERSRVNLITNVSHDLRTPLTSIIGYLDLLSKVDLPPEARDYVTVLTDKSNRLNHLVSDVFALSKANSGAEEIPMEDLDLFLLVRQMVAELSDSADAAGKTVLLSGEGTAPIYSNGNKIYRILQNMLDNALKYSLVGTRIFVTLKKDAASATVTVKNTACYEMNFSTEDIMEQFVRGDPSRTGEGSGLGLAISRSFAEQLGARFRIFVDGDQFSSVITFPLKPVEDLIERKDPSHD